MLWFSLGTLVIIPLIIAGCEAFVHLRARSATYVFSGIERKSFRILVPIWGNIRYLENSEYLKKYTEKVTLCTTGDESKEFYGALFELSKKYGFHIFIDTPQKSNDGEGNATSAHSKRSTSGTIRDRIVNNALGEITEEYVIPLDADSTAKQNLSRLVAEMVAHDYDIASIRIVPTNTKTLLGRLQMLEYDLAMRFRFIAPWLISGACHPAKTKVLQDIMDRHSLFFQGNDVETGLIAKSLGYNVGHIPFVIYTAVPDTFKAWFRQRLAWAGGEFRLFIINFKFILKHPFFWFYGAIVSILLFPFRALALLEARSLLLYVCALYLVLLIFIHWRSLSFKTAYIIPMYLLYILFLSICMLPLGVYQYFVMAKHDHNLGIITTARSNAKSR